MYNKNKEQGNQKKKSQLITKDAVDYSLIKEYGELLRQAPWRNRRQEVISRDDGECCHCHKKGTINWGGFSFSHAIVLGYRGKTPIDQLVPSQFPVFLEVHHKKYILSHLPWDYADEDLETLCHPCHQLEHQNVIIPIYRDDFAFSKGLTMGIDACWKCGGSGRLPEYNYHENGVCFGCNGLGFVRAYSS